MIRVARRRAGLGHRTGEERKGTMGVGPAVNGSADLGPALFGEVG